MKAARATAFPSGWAKFGSAVGAVGKSFDVLEMAIAFDTGLDRSEGQNLFRRGLAIADEGSRAGLGIAASGGGAILFGSGCAGSGAGTLFTFTCAGAGAYAGQTVAHGVYDGAGWVVEHVVGWLG